jgi:uncharacterized repeat protein (TIGR02543 family)
MRIFTKLCLIAIWAVFDIQNTFAQTGLVINEVMSNNGSFKADEDGDNEDWLEIFNGSSADVNLLNYGLTDDATNLGKWKFPNITIPNGGYLVVWASGKNRKPGADAPTLGMINKRYENIKGTTIAALTGFVNYPNNPDSKYIVSELKTSEGLMDEYGEQYYGWFTAPTSGNYIFSISGKNEATFSLSTDASEANLVQRCSVSSAGTNIGTFNNSSAIALVAGQKYFFKALHKENESFYSGTMDDHLTVRVQYPNGTIENPLSAINCTVPYTELHANFGIATLGETLTLSDPTGLILSTLGAVNLSKTNIAYGRSPNGSETFGFFETPTPGAANTSTAFEGVLPKPSFSQIGGFFNSNQSVSISHSDASAGIIYTLDGSNPMISTIGGVNYNYKNSYPNQTGAASFGPMLTKQIRTYNYTVPLSLTNRSKNPPAANDISTISSTTDVTASYLPTSENVSMGNVVRAVATKTNWISSDVATENYFIFPNGASKFTLPVMSINTHTPDFVGYENGIHVPGKDYDNLRMTNGSGTTTWQLNDGNFTREGSVSERRANMAFIKNGTSVLNQDIGIRIQGDATRFLPVKTIRMYPRSEYSGSSTFNYQFYPNDNTAVFRRMFMRNSSQDYNNTLLRDGLIQTSVNHLNFSTQKYTPIITFINGEYYGLTDLRERIDAKYIEEKYGVAEDEVDIINLNGRRGPEAKDGDLNHYNALMNYTNTNNLATQSNFDYVTTQIDPESIIDYYITGVFYNSVDWPYNNNTFWRKKTTYTPAAPYGQDGRYRWTLYGTEIAAGFPTTFPVSPSASLNMIDGLFNTGSQTGDIALQYSASGTRFIRKMIENTGFKNQFITRFADLLNTAFLPTRLNAKLDSMKTLLQPEIPEYATRWNVMGNTSAATTWNSNVAVITNYINAHHPQQRDHIRAKWGISSNQNVVLNVSNPAHGYVKINTIDIKNGTPGVASQPYPWTGVYFNGIPITLTAKALPGYTFLNWSGASTSTSPTITLTPTADITLTANFISNNSPTPIYFWAFTSALPDNTPFVNINSTYSLVGNPAVMNFKSALGAGYPFVSTDPYWRKSGVDRYNNAIGKTDINYLPAANNNVPYASAGILAIKVNPAFNVGGNENSMTFAMPTTGFKDIKFAFASRHDLAANQLIIDYALDKNNPTWVQFETSTITATYQLFNYDFSNVLGVENNPNFAIRIRFGDLLTTAPVRVNFNNVSLIGTPIANSLIVSASLSPTTCINPNAGAITLTATNGQSPYTYLWSNGATTNEVTGLTEGNYTVTVTDNVGNTAVKTTTIPPASIRAGIESNRAIVNCTNPTATLKATGGANYVWGNGETSSAITVNPLLSTTYTVTVTGENGCISTASYILGVEKIAPTATINTPRTELTCTNPSTTLTASGGGVYAWSGGATTAILTVNSAGTYTVTVTGTNGCTAIASQAITENKIIPIASISTDFTSLTCTTPTTNLTASGGVSYLWSNSATTPNISVSPLVTTTYTVTVTNAEGCTATASQIIMVDKTAESTISANRTSVNCTNPTATLTAGGGVNYVWNSGENTASITINPITNTTYTVTVTGSNGCTSTKSQLIMVDLAPPTATISPNRTTVNCSDPSATLTAGGGASYVWDSGQTTASINISPTVNTTYSVTVTASNGCTSTKSQTIVVDKIVPTASITAPVTQLTCETPNITLTASGGGTYLWTGGSTSNTLLVNTAGTYSVTVTISNGCTATSSVIITSFSCSSNTAFLEAECGIVGSNFTVSNDANASNSSYVNFTGTDNSAGGPTNANGWIRFTTSSLNEGTYYIFARTLINAVGNNNNSYWVRLNGGTWIKFNDIPSNANWVWNVVWNSDVSQAPLAFNLIAGVNTIDFGMRETATKTDKILIKTNTTPVTGIGDLGTTATIAGANSICENSSTILTASDGSAYLWNTGATTKTITAGIGNYSVTVTNNIGCPTIANKTISALDAPIASISAPTTELNCSVSNITLTASGIGTYEWTGGTINSELTINSAATYSVTVTGANGCTSTASQQITFNNTPPTASISADFVELNCTNPTTILTASGGGTYLWNTGETTNFITKSPTENTTYSVAVTGSNGCISTAFQEISVNKTLPTASISADFVELNCTNSTTTLTASGGGTYLWNTGETTNSITKSPTENTTYSVAVTGSNGCISTAFQEISVNKTLPTASISADFTNLNCTNPTAILTAGGVGTYLWSSGETTASISVSPIANTIYTVTITGSNGCISTKSQEIIVDKTLPNNEITSSNGLELNCNFINTTLNATESGTYVWSNMATTQSIIVSTAGTYSATVTGANGCTNVGSMTISKIENIVATPTVTNASCNTANGSIVLEVTGGATPFTYSWSNGENTKDIFALSSGIYSVTVSDKNGCTTVTSTSISQPTTGSISSSVWIDANGNGLQEITETSLDGVPVKLFLANPDGTPNGLSIQNSTTSNDGKYNFTNICAGNYVLQFENFGSYVRTFKSNNLTKDLLDSDVNATTGLTDLIAIAEGENDLTNQAGYYLTSKIDGTVFVDKNGNNIKNTDDSGLVGVEISLIGTNGGGQNVALNTVSGANGAYGFENLAPGSYNVTINNNLVPQNSINKNWNAKIQLADVYVPSSNNTFNVTVGSGTDNIIYNAGYFVPANISSTIWDDQNKNGIRDNGEPGLANISINISGVEGDGVVVPPISITSDANGLFSFGNLSPGNYTITFTSPIGYIFTDSNIGSDENIDSDAVNGVVNNVQIISGETISNISAGFKTAVALAVDLIDFNGKIANNEAVLNWKVANETDFAGYEIQRSTNKLEFASIGNVKAASRTHYNFVDKNPENAVNYYRLKMINNDGTFKFSKSIALDFGKETIFAVAENPVANGAFNLYTNAPIQKFVLSNILGIQMPINSFEMSVNNYKVFVQNPVSGLYFLKLNNGKNHIIRKILIP